MGKLNRLEVKAFADAMFKAAGLKPVKKDSKWQMWVIARVLGFMKIVDKKRFMKYYAITFRGKCYLPFESGIPTNDFPLLEQVLLITHECEHGYQQLKEGWRFNKNYIFSSAKRGMYEAEANTAVMEIYYHLTGKLVSSSYLARKLKNYACTENDIKLVEKKLELAQKAVKLGGVTTKAAKRAIKTLEKKRS
jgi:hypothetical protein